MSSKALQAEVAELKERIALFELDLDLKAADEYGVHPLQMKVAANIFDSPSHPGFGWEADPTGRRRWRPRRSPEGDEKEPTSVSKTDGE